MADYKKATTSSRKTMKRASTMKAKPSKAASMSKKRGGMKSVPAMGSKMGRGKVRRGGKK